MKDCKFCDKTGLRILPLRYAVLADESAQQLMPDLPSTLGQSVSGVKLTYSRYVPRMLREGYVYVLISREGVKYWEAYASNPDAYLYKFPVDTPPDAPVEFTCDASTCGIDASCIAIDKVAYVDKIWVLFTPDLLTSAKLKEYKKNADTYAKQGKLQVFDPKAWSISKQQTQQNTLKPAQLSTCVPEWVLYGQDSQALSSPLGLAMQRQLFPALSAAFAGPPPAPVGQPWLGRLGKLQQKLQTGQDAVLVLADPIGITQELNDFRNAALEPIEAYLATSMTPGVSNQRKLEISQAIEDIKTGFQQGYISTNLAFLERMRANSDEYLQQQQQQADLLRAYGRESEARQIEENLARTYQIRDENYSKMVNNMLEEAKIEGPKKWEKKYGKRINQSEINDFLVQLKSLTDQATQRALDRAPDHLAWLASDALLNAFDAFDKQSLISGFEYAMEYSVCTDGATFTTAGEQQVTKWAGSTELDRRNLYLRAFAFNQTDLETQVAAMLSEVHAQSEAVTDAALISSALGLKATKGVVDVMKKIDSAWDEWLRDGKVKEVQQGKATDNDMHNTLSKWHKSIQGRTAKWVSELTQMSSRAAMANPVDKKLVAVGAAMLYSRMGTLAEKINFETLMLKIPPEKLQDRKTRRDAMRQVNKQQAKDMKALAPYMEDPLADLLEDARKRSKEQVKLSLDQLSAGERPATNNYHQVRLGAILVGIESIALANKAQHFKESPRAMAELAASMMSLGSILLDMQYALAKSIREIEPFKSAAATKPMLSSLDAIRGGYKLAAGALSTGAGVIGVGLDLSSGWTEGQKDRPDRFLQAVYWGRALMSGTATYFGAMAAVSYCGGLLNQLPKDGRWRHIAKWAAKESTEEAVKNLVARRTLLLIRVARFNTIGLVLTAVEIGWLWYRDNDLQNWFDACTFRADKSTGIFKAKPYSTTEQEMDALMKARAEVSL